MSHCLITGCALNSGGFWVNGDLHEEGGVFIFNACLGEDGEANWVSRNDRAEFKFSRQITMEATGTIFERRGVIVVDKNNCGLNDDAAKYLACAWFPLPR